jgi:hypothetical protein
MASSSWQTIIQEVNSNENKALLWSLLSEEQVFSGLSETSMQPIITLFETAIHTTINTYAQNTSSATLSNLNKDVIQRVIKDVAQYKLHVASGPLYKSADIQEARIKDITSKVKVLENDMNAFLVLKKPPEIDFSDKNRNDDTPIGDNMDQLIKDALAARERELEVIQFDIPSKPQSQKPLLPPSSPPTTNNPIKKTVSFEPPLTDTELEIGSIFNKLKKAPLTSSTQGVGVNTNTSPNPMQLQIQMQLDAITKSIQELCSMVTALSSEVQFIKNNMFEFESSVISEIQK